MSLTLRRQMVDFQIGPRRPALYHPPLEVICQHRRIALVETPAKSAGEIAASKPFADLDATWGKGFFNGDVFVQVVYSTL